MYVPSLGRMDPKEGQGTGCKRAPEYPCGVALLDSRWETAVVWLAHIDMSCSMGVLELQKSILGSWC
jgi:hypothetical protein